MKQKSKKSNKTEKKSVKATPTKKEQDFIRGTLKFMFDSYLFHNRWFNLYI